MRLIKKEKTFVKQKRHLLDREHRKKHLLGKEKPLPQRKVHFYTKKKHLLDKERAIF